MPLVLVTKVPGDVEHAALRAAAWMLKIVIIKPATVVQSDGEAAFHGMIGQSAQAPLHHARQRYNSEAHALNGSKVLSQGQVIILSVAIAGHVHGMVGQYGYVHEAL